MSADIDEIEFGTFARSEKVNELIAAIESITSMSVREGDGEESPGFTFGEKRCELVTTSKSTGSLPDFNVSLAVCNSGTPGYINVIYDAEKGFYTSAPEFPLPAP